MEKIKKEVGLKLDNEEKKILLDAENLIYDMKKELSNMDFLLDKDDFKLVDEALKRIGLINERYDVYLDLEE